MLLYSCLQALQESSCFWTLPSSTSHKLQYTGRRCRRSGCKQLFSSARLLHINLLSGAKIVFQLGVNGSFLGLVERILTGVTDKDIIQHGLQGIEFLCESGNLLLQRRELLIQRAVDNILHNSGNLIKHFLRQLHRRLLCRCTFSRSSLCTGLCSTHLCLELSVELIHDSRVHRLPIRIDHVAHLVDLEA